MDARTAGVQVLCRIWNQEKVGFGALHPSNTVIYSRGQYKRHLDLLDYYSGFISSREHVAEEGPTVARSV